MKTKLKIVITLVLAVLYSAVSSGMSAQSASCSSAQSSNEHRINYTVNLMWINRVYSENQRYIHPSCNLEELQANLLNKVFQWTSKNPDSTIIVWYDGAHISTQAIDNTYAAMHSASSATDAHIVLKDVRELPEVINNPAVFSEKTPVYFRADLLRIIAGIRTVAQNTEPTYFVYADTDVQPMTQEELFDPQTYESLNRFGIVMCADEQTSMGYENSFFILSNTKPHLITALQRCLIELNIIRAHNALNGNLKRDLGTAQGPMKILQEIIYFSHRKAFEYYCHLEGFGTLSIDSCNRWKAYPGLPHEEYDYTKHGLEFFGTKTIGENNFAFTLADENLKAQQAVSKKSCFVPTKKVSCPPIKGYYDAFLPDSERPYLSPPTQLFLFGAAIVGAVSWLYYINIKHV